ncbi:RGG repeats nuclear RNA binding protein A-like [Apium graveolens]|uniref:Hyaluronan/mRNA-binding protein domain-containing protein n=1 Tax=Apium graveolens TaxID=4045 RepID=A0A6L5BCX6_APIGR|nr:hypothetical protein AG4045_011314 [Apium graveolens]
MATANPFDLLGDDDNDDVLHLIALQHQKKSVADKLVDKSAKPAADKSAKPAAKLPSKPLPPAQAVKEATSEGARGGGRGGGGGGRGYGRRDGGVGGYDRRGGGYDRRDGGGYDRDSSRIEKPFGNGGSSGGQAAIRETDSGRTFERHGGYDGPHSGFRGERRGGHINGGEGDRPRRVFERRSGTGRGNEYKREGSGRGNWGSQTDELSQVPEEVTIEGEKKVDTDKPSVEDDAPDGNKEKPTNEPEEKEPEEMTLEEYQKILEEKRKALEALKTEERKVEIDKDLAAMQPLSSKKSNDEIFARLGSDKEKRREIAEKEERAKKSLSINEFLKPAEGEKYYNPGGRGRGRGRGSRGGFGGGSGVSGYAEAPAIGDPSEFPTLGAK